MARLRTSTLSRYSSRYDKFAPYGDSVCTYCGGNAWTWDHVPSLAEMTMRDATGYPMERGRMVRACNDCNTRLGAYPRHALQERRNRIADMLQRKYHKNIAVTKWNDREQSELGRGLLDYVSGSMAFAEALEARLAWLRHPPKVE